MRNHRKLRAFELADSLVLDVYKATKSWPSDERFGLTAQIRRAAVSIASNIVEGCGRTTEREYLRFIEIAYSSCREVAYQLSIARRLEMHVPAELETLADNCCRALYVLYQRTET